MKLPFFVSFDQIFTQTIPPHYKERLKALQAELVSTVNVKGAWVEDKDLLVAWHYRFVRHTQFGDVVHNVEPFQRN